MNSIPERFQSTDLFDDNVEETYILRGLFAYQDGHYFSFFRRILMKTDEVVKGSSDDVRLQT